MIEFIGQDIYETMPKTINDNRETPAKLIFKNSRNTINTYSKTCSGASQFYTKSLILQLKQNLPKENYYEENGTVKRDLSIETDICILRGYYKKRRNRLINHEASTKSKYSVNHAEIDTIDEFKYDSSACGDSKGSVQLTNTHFNINLTSLVIENLRNLLNDWIKKYLLDNNDTKQKIESVLDSILHKLDLQTKDTSSSCTYTVDIEVIDQNTKLNKKSLSSTSQDVEIETLNSEQNKIEKKSLLTIPLSGKCLRIFSTLSVPKNVYRRNKFKYSWDKLNKIRHKKILLSTNGSSKYLFTSSSLNFLTLPTKSLTKRCATYQQNSGPKITGELPGPILPKEFYDGELFSDSIAGRDEIQSKKFQMNKKGENALNPIPSIYNNIYKDLRRNDGHNSISNDLYYSKTKIRENTCLSQDFSRKNINEQDKSDPLVTIDFINQSFELANRNKENQGKLNDDVQMKISNNNEKSLKCTRRRKTCKKYASRFRKYKRIKSKQFTYLLTNSKNHIQREKELLDHFQSILKYFSSLKCGEDMKLDIHVNVFPLNDTRNGKQAMHVCENSHSLVSPMVTTSNKQSIPKGPSHNDNIIPLLDGADSQAKYIISRETSTDSSDNSNHKNNLAVNCITTDSKIAQEISELKVIIKSLATTTEKLVKDHLSKKKLNKDPTVLASSTDKMDKPCENVENLVKPSKGIQFTSKTTRSEVISGIKLKKDPKKKHKDYNPRLMKKSTSYNIIDSESILKVTDMTSAAQGIPFEKSTIDKALTCSLPKSKSLFEVSLGTDEKKLLAFYCDDYTKPNEYIYSFNQRNNPCSTNTCKDPCQYAKPPVVYPKVNQNKYCNENTCANEKSFECTELITIDDECDLCDNSSSSICIDIDSKSYEKKLTIRNRSGVSFCEGCLYCFLLWIPALLISWLFYVYVLKEWLSPKGPTAGRLTSSENQKSNGSYFPLTLTDLGF